MSRRFAAAAVTIGRRARRPVLALALLASFAAGPFALAGAPPAAQKKKRAKPAPAAAAKNAPAAAAKPQIPEAFRKSVARETDGGMTVVDARATATTKGRYLAVVYRYPASDPDSPNGQSLKIYYQANGEATRVQSSDLIEDESIGFGTLGSLTSEFVDVNGDGFTELVVHTANGGNCWGCARVLLYKLDGDELHWLASEPMDLRDVDGNGSFELLVTETRWEGYLARAYSPTVPLLYAWRFGGYVFAGPDYPGYYDAQIAAFELRLAEAKRRSGGADDAASDQEYVGAALSIYMAYALSGRTTKGRDELRRLLLEENVPGEATRARRAEIVEDFLNGESARMLTTPPRGKALARAERRVKTE